MNMKLETRNGLTLPIWETFKLEGFIDNLNAYCKRGLELADEIALIPNPTFDDVIIPFVLHSKENNLILSALGHLKQTVLDKYTGISEIQEEATQISSAYANALSFHKGLFQAYVKVRDSKDFSLLTDEQKYIITEGIKSFELNGINLPKEEQERLKILSERGSLLENKFETNVTMSTEAWTLDLTDDSRLKGVDSDSIEMFRKEANRKGFSGYSISLKTGPYLAIQHLAEDRSLREEMWRAYASRASKTAKGGSGFDNSDIIVELIRIRNEEAKILGFSNYCELSISNKMAGGVGVIGVDKFFETLMTATLKKSELEISELSKFAMEEYGIDEIMPWDTNFLILKHKAKLFSVDDEEIRNYFPTQNVIDGFYSTMTRLFGCTFKENKEVSVWHPDVKFYEVCNENGDVFAGFYVDLFERKGKRGGAWMDDYNKRIKLPGINELPTAFLICNLKDVGNGKNYLSHDEIKILFHEGGHVLHHLLTEANYPNTNMMGVEWDTVELPSQLLEEWAWKKDFLQSISVHKETGESIPDELFERMIQSKNHMSGLYNGRQVAFGLYDWEIHKKSSVTEDEFLQDFKIAFEKSVATKVHPDQRGPQTFAHIFAGGYSAGYFSYNWANCLVADVWSAFKEAGIEHEKDVATRYKNEILAYGAMRPLVDSFRAFRGLNPKPELLIPFLGLE